MITKFGNQGEEVPKQVPFFVCFMATISIGIAGAFISIAMPGILLAISQNVDFPSDRAAMFASVEVGGMLVSTLLLGHMLNTVHRRILLTAAMVAIVAGNIISIFFYETDAILLARLLAGIGEGIAVGALGAAANAFPNPDRLFALFMSTNMGLVAVYLFLLPKIILAGGIPAVFILLSGLAILGLLSLPYFPPFIPPETVVPRTTRTIQLRGFSKNALLGLIACFGLNSGVGMVWPFMGNLGEARGIPPEAISAYLAMATFAGIAAGFCAALLGLRYGRRLPLGLATLCLIASGIGLVQDDVSYPLCAILFLFFWVFATSYFMGTVAAAKDGAGAAVLIPVAQLGGLAVGPQLSAIVIGHFSLSWIVLGGGIICAMSAASALAANSHFDPDR